LSADQQAAMGFFCGSNVATLANHVTSCNLPFSPRLSLAYSPNKADGLLGKIIGGPGKTSISAGYGIFYSVIQGNTIAFDEPQSPYGSTYASAGGAPLFAAPFINATDGAVHVQPFPLKFPPLNASIDHPNPNIDFSPFLPQAGMTTPNPNNTYPYNENYFFSIERQLAANTVLGLSYVGSQAHHLLVVYSANPAIRPFVWRSANLAPRRQGRPPADPLARVRLTQLPPARL
jgi:hypothetical protein